jgi:hypothetical protein
MLSKISFFHGSALIQILNHACYKSVIKYREIGGSYLINNSIKIYIKYSQEKLPPWRFTFSKEHILETISMHNEGGNLYIVLVCNEDGICCLNWKEFETIISVENRVFPKWIAATRRKNEKYTIWGRDGKLKHKIGNSDFPEKLFS